MCGDTFCVNHYLPGAAGQSSAEQEYLGQQDIRGAAGYSSAEQELANRLFGHQFGVPANLYFLTLKTENSQKLSTTFPFFSDFLFRNIIKKIYNEVLTSSMSFMGEKV